METYGERILRRIVIDEGGCWIWQGARRPAGYGIMSTRHGQAPIDIHRASYLTWVGSIPDGLDIDHLCRVRACCNPAHLEAVTRKENLRRGAGIGGAGSATLNLAKTHCPQGHPYDEANTYQYGVHRHCRQCRVAAEARYRAKGS